MESHKDKKKEDHISISEQHFEPLIGKKYKVVYKSVKDAINKYKLSLEDMKLNYIEGYLENFSPTNNAVFYSEEYGFNIICYKSIVQMEHIIDEE